MKVQPSKAILLLALLVGCTPPAGPRGPERSPAVEQRAVSIIPLGIPVRVGGADFLTKLAVTFSREGQPIPYREAEIPVAHGQGGLVFQLEPLQGTGPGIRYEVVESRSGSPVILRFSSPAPLPDVFLQAAAPAGLLPVRLEPQNEPEVMHSLIGPAWFAACDALYDPGRDRAVSIDRPFQYTPGQGPEGMLGLMILADGSREAGVTFQSYAGLLKSRFQFTPPAGAGHSPLPNAAAGWCIMRPVGAADIAEVEAWLKGNLAFGGELTRVPAAGGVPELLCAQPASGGAPAPAGDQTPGRAWKKRLDKTRDIYHRVTERGDNYNWQHVRELLATTVEDYWSHGIVRSNVPGPLFVAAPLSLEHARMWVSLLGLSGQTVVLGDDLAQLPVERVELLRAILPPAAVRTTDLFAHGLPEQWVLMATRPWQIPDGKAGVSSTGGAGVSPASSPDEARPSPVPIVLEPVMVVGLFNWSLEPQSMTVRFVDLMPALAVRPGGAEAAFAVWDVWERRLIAVAKDTLTLPMRPASHRLLCIVPAAADRPVLVSAGRHIAQGQLELKELRWDAGQTTMSGAVDLPAGDPYELRILVPEGNKSFEIEAAKAEGAAALVARDGPIRRATLTADRDGHVRWTVKFRPASQPLEAPSAPVGLSTKQNTRGVLLAWQDRDERAALYRVYRDGKLLAEAAEPGHQDSTAEYNRQYAYALAAVDYAGRESSRSAPVVQRTPSPASTNLTDLVPLLAEQEHLAVASDTSAAGNPLRVAGKRYHRGLGTHSNARIRYYLGGGYQNFTGEVGIDDETNGQGSSVFKIIADGQTVFISPVMRGGAAPQPFSVSVRDRMALELIVTDGGDNPDNDHADWGNPYLEARTR